MATSVHSNKGVPNPVFSRLKQLIQNTPYMVAKQTVNLLMTLMLFGIGDSDLLLLSHR